MQLSFAEENYLKAIFKLKERESDRITTNSIASSVAAAPASVTDMVQKLHEKKLVNYAPYRGVSLTNLGRKSAIEVVRKHRLWELFLVTELGYNWDEVHEIAEQLEHIKSDSLVKKLYAYLGRPKWDPHGDPIPDEKGNFYSQKALPLIAAKVDERYEISGVLDHSADFLKFLGSNGFSIGKTIILKNRVPYEGSLLLSLGRNKAKKQISAEVAKNILVTLLK